MSATILLVDDDAGVRKMLTRLLTEEGYAVHAAASGAEALDVATHTHADIAVLDLNLPDSNGWETLRKLTTGDLSLPVVLITALSNQLFPALAAGAGALLEKPLDIPKLLRSIKDLLAETADIRRQRQEGHASEFHYSPGKKSAPVVLVGPLR